VILLEEDTPWTPWSLSTASLPQPEALPISHMPQTDLAHHTHHPSVYKGTDRHNIPVLAQYTPLPSFCHSRSPGSRPHSIRPRKARFRQPVLQAFEGNGHRSKPPLLLLLISSEYPTLDLTIHALVLV
jgi:hypothetical protein